ncbi:MAG: ABC transporter permease, partial [Gorillibacterium sp.]|nr:ABC transporter permease [Gorillibacterium sp.]
PRVTPNTAMYMRSTEPIGLQEDIEEIKGDSALGNISIFNVYQYRQREKQMIQFTSVFVFGFVFLITAICVANIFNTISTSISLRKREFAMLRSVGMTPAGFTKMIRYESVFYGIKALLYGLPLSFGAMLLIYRSLSGSFVFGFIVPWWSVFIAVFAVFIIVFSAMMYSSSRVKKENIMEGLKQENI